MLPPWTLRSRIELIWFSGWGSLPCHQLSSRWGSKSITPVSPLTLSTTSLRHDVAGSPSSSRTSSPATAGCRCQIIERQSAQLAQKAALLKRQRSCVTGSCVALLRRKVENLTQTVPQIVVVSCSKWGRQWWLNTPKGKKFALRHCAQWSTSRAMPIGHRELLEFAQAMSRALLTSVQKGCDEVVMLHTDSQNLDPLLTRVQSGTSPHHCPRIFIASNLLQHITRSGSNSSHVPHLGLSPMHPDPSVGEKFLLEDNVNTANPLWLWNHVHVVQEGHQPLLWSELLLRVLHRFCPRTESALWLVPCRNEDKTQTRVMGPRWQKPDLPIWWCMVSTKKVSRHKNWGSPVNPRNEYNRTRISLAMGNCGRSSSNAEVGSSQVYRQEMINLVPGGLGQEDFNRTKSEEDDTNKGPSVAVPPRMANMRFSNYSHVEKVYQCVQKKLGRAPKNCRKVLYSYKTKVLTWELFMTSSMKAVIHFEWNFQENSEIHTNMKFENIENVFNITQKLIKEQSEEILNVKVLDHESPSWARSSLLTVIKQLSGQKRKFVSKQTQFYAWVK